MCEVLEKKKLELNEKVDFSVAPVSEGGTRGTRRTLRPDPFKGLKGQHFGFSQHESAEGGSQAIRIKRYAESVFLPARKLGGVGAGKGKVRSPVGDVQSCFHAISL